MKYLLLVIVAIHGLIHLMGFAKAFGLASFEQLRVPISQPLGLLWLAAALLFLLSVVLLLTSPNWWWAPALGAVVISQLVIITAWSDARFGTLANLIVLVPAVVAGLGYAPWSYRAQYMRDVAAALAEPPAQAAPVTEADLAHLPSIVQKYLRFAGVVGQPQVHNYRLAFRGELRNGPNNGWMPVAIDQQSFVNPAERLFFIDAQMFGVPLMAVLPDSGYADMTLTAEADGRVTSVGLGPQPLRWVPVAPDVLRRADGRQDVYGDLVFGADEGGRLTRLYMQNNPFRAYERAPWYATGAVSLSVLVGSGIINGLAH